MEILMEEVEIWKDIPNYEGLYQVSSFGRVKSLERSIIRKNGRKQTFSERILKPIKNRKGYLRVYLYKNRKMKHFLVHKLVCLVFLKNDYNLPQINHKDENKENNFVDNLEWVTPKENVNYGTRNERAGKSISQAKKGKPLTEEHKQKLSISHKGKPQYKQRKPILQYTLDGEFIRYWDSTTTASIELNLCATNIYICVAKINENPHTILFGNIKNKKR